tara:strand:+ start:1560 stop:2918 length:1359 start_codon:yes stop_codon:yes gene_type:complete
MNLSSQKKFDLLKTIDPFSLLDQQSLISLTRQSRNISLDPGELLFCEGSTGEAMYVIMQGELNILKDNKVVVVRRPCEFIGEMALIESQPRSASVRAKTAALLIEITEEQFNRYLISHPRVMHSILKVLSSRNRHALEILDVEMKNSELRKNFLSRLRNVFEQSGSGEMFFFNTTNFELIHANAAACFNLGLKKDSWSNYKIFDLFEGISSKKVQEIVETLHSSRTDQILLNSFYKLKNVKKMFVEIQFQFLDNELPPILLSLVRQKDLKNHKSLAFAVEDSYTPMAIIDEDGTLVFGNTEFWSVLSSREKNKIPSHFSLSNIIKKEINTIKNDEEHPIYNPKDIGIHKISEKIFKASLLRVSKKKTNKKLSFLLRLKPIIEPYNPINNLLTERGLSKREIEVALLMKEGMDRNEISKFLSLSIQTVISHIKSIYRKMEVHSIGQLVAKLNQ